jgi:hypothetical protein
MGKSITPPFSKGGPGRLYKRWKIPLNPPLEKGDLKASPPQLLLVDSLPEASE